MAADLHEALKLEMQQKKQELESRLERITANVRRRYDTDSKEMAKELEDSEVVDALGNEAREEIAKISAALLRMDVGEYGNCLECGGAIDDARLKAYPYADECIDCARLDERRRERPGA